MAELTTADDDDPLFIERLQAFLDKNLADLHAFSKRENRPFDQTRRRVADWHARYLFHPQPAVATNNREYIQSVLTDTSQALESLQTLSGIHSFFLAVNPTDPTDQGFLGGTVLGREFWRGLRGGGDVGAKSFRFFCMKSAPAGQSSSAESTAAATTIKRSPASSIKAEVYANVRDALRLASTNRTAEMKWTNHARLQSAYAVRLIGWPPGVPMRNPSALTVVQNRMVLEALGEGKMWFEKMSEGIAGGAVVAQGVSGSGDGGGEEIKRGVVHVDETEADAAAETAAGEVEEDISWAYDYHGPSTSNTPSEPTLPKAIKSFSNPTSAPGGIIPRNEEAGPSSHSPQPRLQHHPISPNFQVFSQLNVHDDLTDQQLGYGYDATEQIHAMGTMNIQRDISAELRLEKSPQQLDEDNIDVPIGIQSEGLELELPENELLQLELYADSDGRAIKRRRVDGDGDDEDDLGF